MIFWQHSLSQQLPHLKIHVRSEVLAEIKPFLVPHSLGDGFCTIPIHPRFEEFTITAHMEFLATGSAKIPETYPAFRQYRTTEKTHAVSLPVLAGLCNNPECI
jgi:hypothetical protein